jgi:hypothetical protein
MSEPYEKKATVSLEAYKRELRKKLAKGFGSNEEPERKATRYPPSRWDEADEEPPPPPGWNENLKWFPKVGFNPREVVEAADFTKSICVITSRKNNGRTRYAYTYVKVSGYWVCVVGHIHYDDREGWVAGNSFIPGYDNWEMPTPEDAVAVIDSMEDGGRYPEDDNIRYPHPV